jgi:pimeloyl-ACP methyl ester carboxylesterase
VHGATGSPLDWKYLVSKLDRSRFQPWFAYYPASPHLDRIGDQIVRALSSLQAKYKFEKMILVAHSMGGLVTRAALDYVVENVGTGRIVNVPAFVSISSPWGGMASASLGVEHAPVVAPMWQIGAAERDSDEGRSAKGVNSAPPGAVRVARGGRVTLLISMEVVASVHVERLPRHHA